MTRHRHIRTLSVFLLVMIALILSAAAASAAAAKKPPVLLSIKKIFFEYNSTASAFGDLGVHVFLDGEDWKEIKIINPDGRTIFDVEGKGPYKELGMTELFFEGAEPDLADVPLQELLDKFPAGDYKFVGRNVDGDKISDTATLSHAIPAGPTIVSAVLNGDGSLTITWNKVTGIPNNPNVTFPNEPINVVAYQVIVSDFQVTVPATGANTQSVTVSKEYVASLDSGEQLFEVLAIDISGNQTITESSFIKP